jgi:hypothetical protein
VYDTLCGDSLVSNEGKALGRYHILVEMAVLTKFTRRDYEKHIYRFFVINLALYVVSEGACVLDPC